MVRNYEYGEEKLMNEKEYLIFCDESEKEGK